MSDWLAWRRNWRRWDSLSDQRLDEQRCPLEGSFPLVHRKLGEIVSKQLLCDFKSIAAAKLGLAVGWLATTAPGGLRLLIHLPSLTRQERFRWLAADDVPTLGHAAPSLI